MPAEYILQDTGNEIILSGQNIWNVGKATKFTPKFKDRLRKSSKGSKVPVTLSGTIAKKTDQMISVLKQMVNRHYVVVYKDYNGQLVRVGSQAHPLTFSYSGNSGKRPGTFAGIEFEFTGTLLDLPETYTGILPTDGGIVNESEDPNANADPVTVKWNDGTVIAVLRPGQELVLRSEFEVSEIQVL